MVVDATFKAQHRRAATFRTCAGALAVTVGVLALAWAATALRAAMQPEVYASMLRHAMLQASRTAPDGRPYVIVTAANAAYLPFVANMRCSLERATGDARLLVAALDAEAHIGVSDVGSTPVSIGGGVAHAGVAQFGSSSFREITARKLEVVRAVLALGVDVLFVDGDVHFCDRFPEVFEVASTTGAAIVAQRADVTAEVINSGVYFARAGADTIALLDALREYDAANDQVAFNALMCRQAMGGLKVLDERWTSSSQPERCVWRARNVSVVFLPVERYPLGCTTIEGMRLGRMRPDEVAQRCGDKRFALVHYSCWGGWNKKAQMRRRGMWNWDEDAHLCT